MKRYTSTLIILFVPILIGCAALKQAKVDATTCLTDPACREASVAEAKNIKEISQDVLGASPIPFSSNAIAGGIYAIFLIAALIKNGKKKRETV